MNNINESINVNVKVEKSSYSFNDQIVRKRAVILIVLHNSLKKSLNRFALSEKIVTTQGFPQVLKTWVDIVLRTLCFRSLRPLISQKHLLGSASVSTCNNSHTCIFNLLEKCFLFLLLIFTHSYLSYTTLVTDN